MILISKSQISFLIYLSFQISEKLFQKLFITISSQFLNFSKKIMNFFIINHDWIVYISFLFRKNIITTITLVIKQAEKILSWGKDIIC